jgi:hypothetical protein
MGNDNNPVDNQLIDVINAFQNSIKASLDTILQIDSQELAEISPQDFIFDYCSTPLKLLDIRVLELEIRKEVQLQFFSLPKLKEKNKFVPITTMRDIHDSGRRRFQITLHGQSFTIEFKASLVFIVQDSRTFEVEDIKIDNVKLLKGSSKTLAPKIKRFQAFFKPVAQSSIASLMVEGIKRMLSG